MHFRQRNAGLEKSNRLDRAKMPRQGLQETAPAAAEGAGLNKLAI
jgi:hypothetical protein